MSEKISALIFLVPVFLLGVFAGYSILREMDTRQTVVVVDKNVVKFTSNFNNEGDTYFVVVNKDTVSGVFENGEWRDVKQ